MHPAAKFQFERVVREFAQWRAVPADERSPAPAWWWQPAFEVVAQHEEMPPLCSIRLELPLSSTYADGAAVLIAAKADHSADGSSQSGAGWADVRAVKPPAIGPQSSHDHRLAFLCKLVCCRDASHSRADNDRKD